MDLQFSLENHPGYRVLAITGEIDTSTGPMLRSRLLGLLVEGGSPVLVDMTAVPFCDSTGLNIAVAANRDATARQCRLGFVGLTERVRRLFRISGVDQFVAIYPTLDDGVLDLTVV